MVISPSFSGLQHADRRKETIDLHAFIACTERMKIVRKTETKFQHLNRYIHLFVLRNTGILYVSVFYIPHTALPLLCRNWLCHLLARILYVLQTTFRSTAAL